MRSRSKSRSRTNSVLKGQISRTKLKINNKRLDKQTNRKFVKSLSNVKGSEVIDEKGEKQSDRHLKNSF